jgi:glutaredoxin-related protein
MSSINTFTRGLLYGTECTNSSDLYLYCHSDTRAQLFTILEGILLALHDYASEECIFVLDGDISNNVIRIIKQEFPGLLMIKYDIYRPSYRKPIYIAFYLTLTKQLMFQQMKRGRLLKAEMMFLPFSVFTPFKGQEFFVYFSGSLYLPLYLPPHKLRALLHVKRIDDRYSVRKYDSNKFEEGIFCNIFSANTIYTVGKSWDLKNHILGYYDDYNTAAEYWIIYGYLKKTITDQNELHRITVKKINRLNTELNKISDNNKVMCHIYNYIERLKGKGTKKEIMAFFKMKDELFQKLPNTLKIIKKSNILTTEEIEEQIKSYSNTPWFFFNLVDGDLVIYRNQYNDLKMEMYRLSLMKTI